MADRPPEPYTHRSTRVAAASRLRRRRDRDAAGRFLVEGPQSVREVLAGTGMVRELFVTVEGARRHPDLLAAAGRDGVPVSRVTDRAAAALTETVTPQGVVAISDHIDVPLAQALAMPRAEARGAPAGAPAVPVAVPPDPVASLVAVLVDIRDPGNAGTVLRTADAAGAAAVVFAGDTVDPYNGKCVRASAGSLFHLNLVRSRDPAAVLDALRAAGLRVLAASGGGETDLDALAEAGGLAGPTAWLFGSEAHGLPPALAAAADQRVRVPIHGFAESLNLGAAAAVCLYASARALSTRRRQPGAEDPLA